MNYQEFCLVCESLQNSQQREYPYNDPKYLNYIKLNPARMKRWDKQLELDKFVVRAVQVVPQPEKWLIITEPWCGDGAHIIPLLVKLSDLNMKMSYDIQLRDEPPYLINKYLTNGSKSIPKLIVRDHLDADLFTWVRGQC